MNKKTALIILDGWGIGNQDESDGVYLAKTPFFDSIIADYPNATLKTYGEHVGLPNGQMGNSEVGHLNIGAGRIVYQDLLKIDRAIEDSSFHQHPVIKEAIDYALNNKKPIHLMGLVSEGGVHSSLAHLLALCAILKNHPALKVYIHGFSDGRDCSPVSGVKFFEQLMHFIEGSNIKLATLIGRYYAMDRDQRWERIKQAYDLLVNNKGERFENVENAFKENYSNDVTDEFLPPISFGHDSNIKEDDVVICFNFRTDRCRQITTALTQENKDDFDMKKLRLKYLTMTNYDKNFRNIDVVYDKKNIYNTLGEVISNHHATQLRIAETEKYPHVTYFFSGGREKEFSGEHRKMADSPKVATYDLKPEMSAFEITEKAMNFITEKEPNFICLNYANPDMVGHTGISSAIIKACETVDQCLMNLVSFLKEKNYASLIIADHGNADKMFNEDGSQHTAHTVNPVPVSLVSNEKFSLKNGVLADIAPTILDLLDMEKPEEMTGNSLIR